MNRFNRFARGAAAALFLAAAFAGAAVILEDDFTDQAGFDQNWKSNLEENMMSRSLAGGVLSVSNTSVFGGEYTHTFAAGAKPSTFTISFTLKSVTGATANSSAGVLFCKGGAGGATNGYELTVLGNMVTLYKWANNSASSIYYKSSFDLKPSDNVFTVSKSGSEIHIFLNGVFQDRVVDNQFPSGDVSFFVPGGISASFAGFRMTDTFTEGKPRAVFTDNFSSSDLKYWELSKMGEPEIKVEGGKLKVKTGGSAVSWIYVGKPLAYAGMPITNFTASVEARHVSGGLTTVYGIILAGKSEPGQQIPMVHFAVIGGGGHVAWSTNDGSYSSKINDKVLGTGQVNRLEVKKVAGSSAYEFSVNGEPLQPDYPVIANFEIIGIGLFCYSGLEVEFGNFRVEREGGTTHIAMKDSKIKRRTPVARNAGAVVYDLKGRARGKAASTLPGRTQVRAAGVYVSENGREVVIRKKR